MANVWVDSFYVDYYDHWLDSPYDKDVIHWERKATSAPDKFEAFELMRDVGIKTPLFGVAGLLKVLHDGDMEVVAYYDPRGHATQGKYKTKLRDVYYDTMLCSRFIPTEGPPSHIRIVHVGNRHAAYRMWSNHEWMSNTGTEIDMEPIFEYTTTRHFNYPVYAVDYVEGYAIDLNLCPGLGKTPIQDAIPAKEAALAIKEWFDRYDQHGNPLDKAPRM